MYPPHPSAPLTFTSPLLHPSASPAPFSSALLCNLNTHLYTVHPSVLSYLCTSAPSTSLCIPLFCIPLQPQHPSTPLCILLSEPLHIFYIALHFSAPSTPSAPFHTPLHHPLCIPPHPLHCSIPSCTFQHPLDPSATLPPALLNTIQTAVLSTCPHPPHCSATLCTIHTPLYPSAPIPYTLSAPFLLHPFATFCTPPPSTH